MRWRQTGGQLQLSRQEQLVAAIPLDAGLIAQRCFRHDPPRPAELEHAIDMVEDALMAVAATVGRPGEFVTDDAVLQRLPGVQAAQGTQRKVRLDAAQVEQMFQQLASFSLGHPSAAQDLPAGREAAATLLLLRETLHHFGVGAVVVEVG